jgi:hypothetical protein
MAKEKVVLTPAYPERVAELGLTQDQFLSIPGVPGLLEDYQERAEDLQLAQDDGEPDGIIQGIVAKAGRLDAIIVEKAEAFAAQQQQQQQQQQQPAKKGFWDGFLNPMGG